MILPYEYSDHIKEKANELLQTGTVQTKQALLNDLDLQDYKQRKGIYDEYTAACELVYIYDKGEGL